MSEVNKDYEYWEGVFPAVDPARVAERLEALREALRLTNAEMSRRIGVSTAQYSNWLPGTKKDGSPKAPTRLRLHHLVAVAERCGVTMDYIGRGDTDGIAEPLRSEILARLRAVTHKNNPKRKS